MPFNKKPLKAQDELIPYSNDLEDRVEDEFDNVIQIGNSAHQRIDSIVGDITGTGARFRILGSGYGQGLVFNQNMITRDDVRIALFVTGRWNSLHLVTYDRGQEKYIHTPILENSRVTISTTATGASMILDANGEWVVYQLR